MDLSALHLAGLLLAGLLAGGLGALLGIGGGLILTPILTLAYGVPIHQAIGTSLCCVIATSTGAAASYVEHHLADIRLGMTLELATTVGAVSGALIAGVLPRQALAVLFAALMIYAGSSMLRRTSKEKNADSESLSSYTIRRLPLGLAGSGAAGIVSGLLGVGGGVIKVPVMYLVMGVPFKVATATSNLMIGVTAAASAFIYFARGDVKVGITAAAATGVFFGAHLGTRLMRRTPSRRLCLLFSVVVFYFAAMMIWKALHGGFGP